MEASAIQAGPVLRRPRLALGSPLLRLRSDQQLVTLFRQGNEDAFEVIHDRYRQRLLAYVRQMLRGRSADIEDALQDVFVRTYTGLRSSDRELALRPWLYRVAHNRCIDELRRPLPVAELREVHDRLSDCDPVADTERREALRRLVVDIERLPEQQRSALLMRELSGMAYAEVAAALGISLPAVKSLLVRARMGLAQAIEARDAACVEIRQSLTEAQDQGVRAGWMARRHLRDCPQCRAFRAEVRVTRRQVAALVPTVGPLAVLAKLFGIGTSAGGGTATAAGAGTAGASGAVAGSAVGAGAASSFGGITVGHVATMLAAAVVTAGSAVAVQQTVAVHGPRHARHALHNAPPSAAPASTAPAPLRPPALSSSPAPAATHPQGPRPRRSPTARPAPVAPAGPAERGRGGDSVAPSTGTLIQSASSSTTSSEGATSSASTCAPPPTACTASSCQTGPGSGTGASAQPTAGTASGTTTGTGAGSGSGPTSGTTSATTGSTCSTPATSQGTGAQGAEPAASGQAGSSQTVAPT